MLDAVTDARIGDHPNWRVAPYDPDLANAMTLNEGFSENLDLKTASGS